MFVTPISIELGALLGLGYLLFWLIKTIITGLKSEYKDKLPENCACYNKKTDLDCVSFTCFMLFIATPMFFAIMLFIYWISS